METTTFIRPLSATRADDVLVVGSKAANLGELLGAGIPVPPGFTVTTEAFRTFLAGSQLAEVLPRHLAGLNVDDPERLASVSARVRKLITAAGAPKALETEFRAAYAALGVDSVAIRASLVAAGPDVAAADQLASQLNVQGADAALQAVKACWASLFDERSLFFRSHQQIDHSRVAVGVLVQQMAMADVSGVMFTADPVSNDLGRMVIEAALGQGEAVLSGTVTPDMYSVDKATCDVTERTIARQHWQVAPRAAGAAPAGARKAVGESEGSRQKLTDAQITELAGLGKRIEEHFGWPQDIEWVLHGKAFQVVQTKPVSGLAGVQGVPWGPRKELTGKLLVSGAPASPGFASGPVRILRDSAQARDVQPGEVLVTAGSHPDFLVAMKRAAAVITDTGGRTSHAAIVGRELGIPCVVGADSASKLLHDGQVVTVDGTWGRVLEGAVQLKSAKAQRQRAAVKTRTGVLVNLAEPDLAEAVGKRDVDGVGLLRAEFMMTDLGEHPRHALDNGRREVWIEQLAEHIERFCAAFTPRMVLYRTSDFNTKEYRSLTGGQQYEGEEENPMLGYRGAARYLNDPEAFEMEMEALKRARQKYTNLSVMVPFVRTTKELQEVKRMLSAHGLRRSKTFELWMMAEVPSNVLLLDQFLDVGIDGVSIGSNDLTQLLLGVDRNNPTLAQLFDERSPAVMLALEHIVTTCKRRDVKVSICGQAPSEYPEITRKLVEWGIDSVSVSPDMIDETRRIVADAERRLAHDAEERSRQPRMPAAPRTYVALDLETTGLDPTQDQIIEVAAVRFTTEGLGETFTSYVKSLKQIPYEVQLLTGIRQADIQSAPPFAAIAGDLLAFLGDATIVAQNAPFDLGFLSSAGLALANPVFDTLELARILTPQLTERSLPALALYFGVASTGKHRALPDATTTAEVFRALRRTASGLDPRTVYSLTNLGGPAAWGLAAFFQEVLAEQVDAGLAAPAPAPLPAVRRPTLIAEANREARSKEAPTPASLDIDLLAHLLEPDGPIAGAFPAYEHRPEQVRLMRTIAEAFNQGEHLLAEAGTGTGKSMAYLLPSLVHALKTDQPVIISTATIALQEQIVTKDIPQLLRALATVAGTPAAEDLPDFGKATFAQLKGRTNYLCLRKWQHAAAAGSLDAGFTARVTVWLATTETGDRAELQLNGFEANQWGRVSATSENCPASQCASFRNGECFLQRARRRAGLAHLVVVNHALLISDVAAGGSVLPSYGYLVIDEAHHLENVATDQLGFAAGLGTFNEFLDRMADESGARPTGFLPSLQVSLRTGQTLAATHTSLLESAADVASQLPAARQKVGTLFGLLGDFLRRNGEGNGEYGQRLRLTKGMRHSPDWSDIDVAWDETRLFLKDARAHLERIRNALESLADFELEDYDELFAESTALVFAAEELEHHGTAVLSNDDGEWVAWLSANTQRDREDVLMCSAPIEVGPMLQRDLFEKKTSVVMTSATLRTAASFSYVKSRLGFEDVREEAVESSFPYQDAALLLLPRDVPDPQHPRYTPALSQALIDLCTASRGRAIVLFTSYGALQTAYRALRPALEPQGFKVLAQGTSGTPHQMLSALRSQPRTVLLGTASFWEGVDVVGEALSLLVITRFPFTVPSEPVFAARSERFDDPFRGYAVPQAVLRFRQGFGRLIRSHNDRGVCVVLDARALTKSYGATFVQSLPPATVQQCLLREAPALVSDWLG